MDKLTNQLSNLTISNNYVIDECDIHDFMNEEQIDTLKQYVSLYISSRIDYYKDNNSNLRIESEFGEYWIAKSTQGSIIGSGNTPMDVKHDEKYMDVACLCLNGSYTNEKSIVQNFAKAGNELDIMFNTNQEHDIVNCFINIITNKWNEYSNSYYGFFISTKVSIYFKMFKINTSNLSNLESGGFSTKGKSLTVNNFINPEQGKTIIYKSKKRMELRLSKNIVNNSILLFTDC